MKLFYWHSTLLKNYAPGHIATFAKTAEEARTWVTNNALALVEREFYGEDSFDIFPAGMTFAEFADNGAEDDMDGYFEGLREEINDRVLTLQDDVSGEPRVAEDNVLFINGSE